MRRKFSFAVFNILAGMVLMHFSFDGGFGFTVIYFLILVLTYRFMFEFDFRYLIFLLLGIVVMLGCIIEHECNENLPFVDKPGIVTAVVMSEGVDNFGSSVYDCRMNRIVFQGKQFDKKAYKVRIISKKANNNLLIGLNVNIK